MKHTTVKASTLATAGRMDARYHIELKGWLDERGLDETEDNVKRAMAAIRRRDVGLKARAEAKRDEAATLIGEARELEDAAELTFPIRPR